MIIKYMKQLLWKIHHQLKAGESKSRQKELLAAILKRRGINKKDQEFFFHPPHPSGIKLTDIDVKKLEINRLVSLIKQLKNTCKKENIVIYGDYDADGVTATAILWEFLTRAGYSVRPFIPHRNKHGYGLSLAGLDEILQTAPKPKLIITVDNGITASQAVSAAKSQKIKVAIIDHHQKTKTLPPADAIIHSTLVSGAGLAWLVTNELTEHLSLPPISDDGLDLAAIGTIADMVPLVGPGRSLAAHGLAAIRKSDRIGLKELIEISGLNQKLLDIHHLGFHLSPRLNAMGRLEHSLDSLRLLCTRDRDRAIALAKLLNQTNRDRQKLTDSNLETAYSLAENTGKPYPIVVADSTFHEGVIGLVAGKLAQQFWRPTVVISQGEIFSKASARSIPGFNIIDVLRKIDKLMESCGGHPMAAGFSIRTDKIGEFIDSFTKISQSFLTPKILTRTLIVDAEINFSDISLELIDILNLLNPTGIGNPSPVFSSHNLTVIDARTVGGQNQHLKLQLEQSGIRLNAIGFGLGDRLSQLKPAIPIAAAYTPFLSTWNNQSRPELKIKDLKTLTHQIPFFKLFNIAGLNHE